MKRIIVVLFSLSLPTHLSFAQILLNVNATCSYYGERNPRKIYGFSSDAEAENAVARIMKYTGVSSNFTIMAANVSNAEAAIRGQQRFILYNQEFMLRVKDATRTDWAALSIMAHEIGHHLSGHTLLPDGSRPGIELEADKFSGFVLNRMGASLDQAQAAIKVVSTEEETATHPAKSARLAAITNGWLEAKGQGTSNNASSSLIPN